MRVIGVDTDLRSVSQMHTERNTVQCKLVAHHSDSDLSWWSSSNSDAPEAQRYETKTGNLLEVKIIDFDTNQNASTFLHQR